MVPVRQFSGALKNGKSVILTLMQGEGHLGRLNIMYFQVQPTV